MAARRLVDFKGPLGWSAGCIVTGRTHGPIVWAPAADGAVVLSLRGGDFELTVGQDFSIGYLDDTRSSVLLYLSLDPLR